MNTIYVAFNIYAFPKCEEAFMKSERRANSRDL